jgi:hypothetical protein
MGDDARTALLDYVHRLTTKASMMQCSTDRQSEGADQPRQTS